MKIIYFFTKYNLTGASSRYRTFQYLESYKNEGYKCIIKPLFSNEYIHLLNKGERSILDIFNSYRKRMVDILLLRNEIVFIEYELFPYLPPVFEYVLKFNNCKIILDYDDAIFHNYDNGKKIVTKFLKNKIPSILKIADSVITGSPYLTQFCSKYSKKVVEIPTSIDYNKYFNAEPNNQLKKEFNIGWIGSKTTSVNILSIKDAFIKFGKNYNYKLSLIGFDKLLESELREVNYEIIEWHSSTEVDEISKFDVGIMPLEFNDFNNGKCGFKLIQYMAVGIPTISTPLEANVKINRSNNNLFANGIEEWVNSFVDVYNNKGHYYEVGMKNRLIVREYYSIQSNYKKYINEFDRLSRE